MEVGAYNFGYTKMPDYVDRFSYQDGLLINYWDGSQSDNDTGTHPGYSLVLPIDAHYEALERNGRNLWRNRIQTYDSTFTLDPTDGIPAIHYNNKLYSIPSLPGVSVFDDRILHYDYSNPLGSVIHPQTGTLIEIVQESKVLYKNKFIPYMEIFIHSEPVEELQIEEIKGKKSGNTKNSSDANISESINKMVQSKGKNLLPLMTAMAYMAK